MEIYIHLTLHLFMQQKLPLQKPTSCPRRENSACQLSWVTQSQSKQNIWPSFQVFSAHLIMLTFHVLNIGKAKNLGWLHLQKKYLSSIWYSVNLKLFGLQPFVAFVAFSLSLKLMMPWEFSDCSESLWKRGHNIVYCFAK